MASGQCGSVSKSQALKGLLMTDKTLETLIAAHILLIKIGKLKLQSSHVLMDFSLK